jgi:hypothetical protein
LSLVVAAFFLMQSILTREPEGPWERSVLERTGGTYEDEYGHPTPVARARGAFFLRGLNVHENAVRLPIGSHLPIVLLARAIFADVSATWGKVQRLWPGEAVLRPRRRQGATWGAPILSSKRKNKHRETDESKPTYIEEAQNPLLPWPERIEVKVEARLRLHSAPPYFAARPQPAAAERGVSPDIVGADVYNANRWPCDRVPRFDTDVLSVTQAVQMFVRQFTYDIIQLSPKQMASNKPRHLLHDNKSEGYTPAVFYRLDLTGLFRSAIASFGSRDHMRKAAKALLPKEPKPMRGTDQSDYIQMWSALLNRAKSLRIEREVEEEVYNILSDFAWLPVASFDKMWTTATWTNKPSDVWILPHSRGNCGGPMPEQHKGKAKLKIIVNVSRIPPMTERQDAVRVGRGRRPRLDGRGGVVMEEVRDSEMEDDPDDENRGDHPSDGDEGDFGLDDDDELPNDPANVVEADGEHNNAAEFQPPAFLAEGPVVVPNDDLWAAPNDEPPSRGGSAGSAAARHVSHAIRTSGILRRRPPPAGDRRRSPVARASPRGGFHFESASAGPISRPFPPPPRAAAGTRGSLVPRGIAGSSRFPGALGDRSPTFSPDRPAAVRASNLGQAMGPSSSMAGPSRLPGAAARSNPLGKRPRSDTSEISDPPPVSLHPRGMPTRV